MGLTALSAAKQNRRRLSTAGVARSSRLLTAAACFAISPLAVRNSGGAAVLVCVLWSASLLPLCLKAGKVNGAAFPRLYGLHKLRHGGEIPRYFRGVNAYLHRAVGVARAELLEACLYAGIQSPAVFEGRSAAVEHFYACHAF